MAQVSLGTLRDLWKVVSDWVQGVSADAPKVTLNGSTMELFGPTINERPAASSVPVGAVYMAVDTGEVWQSNGTTWVVLT